MPAPIMRRPRTWSAARLTESIATSRVAGIVEDGEAAVVRLAAQMALGGVAGEADHLQLDVALVRPEPRHGAIGFALAGERGGQRLRLIDGVLHRFQPHAALQLPVIEGDAIADGEEAGHAGLHEVVDQDAVVDGGAGGLGQRDVRRDADADDGDDRPGCGRPAAVSTATTLPPSPTMRPTAVPRRTSLPQPRWSDRKCARDFRRDDAAHQPVGGFEHRHRLAEQARRAGDLQPDEAAADDHDIAGGMERIAQRARIVGMAEREDAVEVDALDRRQARRRAGGERQRDRRRMALPSVRTTAEPARSMDADLGAEAEIDGVLGVEGFGPERQEVVRRILEERLGERRPLIGHVALGGDQRQRAVIAVAPEARRDLRSAVPAADDDNALPAHANPVSPDRTRRPFPAAPGDA